MPHFPVTNGLSEAEFAAWIDKLGVEAAGRAELLALLREDHSVYDQRGATAVVRMRGWILLALARHSLTDEALLFVLEELDTGRDPYLVAASALALRSYPAPAAAFAPFVMRALNNIRYHDEPVNFNAYGEYATAATEVTPVRELLATLRWLGPTARAVLPELEALRANRASFSRKVLVEFDRTILAMTQGSAPDVGLRDACCSLPNFFGNALSWGRESRRGCEPVESILFEDQDGGSVTFSEFFCRQPCIVVFFYTRCDNPQKCSLTIAKLARIQGLLAERGLSDQIRTAAITYDPSFDGADRIRGYGANRGVRFGGGHRMLRPTGGIDALRAHFKLGVNFVESLVNRHRIEVYLLDAAGAIARSYERIHWDEQEIVAQAGALLREDDLPVTSRTRATPTRRAASSRGLPIAGTLASLGFAFFPKCPFCWAAYLSVFGIAGLEQIPYLPWLKPLFVVLMLLNVFSVWVRSRTTRRATALVVVLAGALAIALSRIVPDLAQLGAWLGVGLTLTGSFLSAMQGARPAASFFLPRAAAPARE
jgi:protein SCO1/2